MPFSGAEAVHSMDTETVLDLWIKGLSGLFAAGAAVAAAMTYRRNERTKAAEFLLTLHRTFFVDSTYERMKRVLDCDGVAEEAELESMVREEPAYFTDFLNFFELVAYLTSIDTLTPEDREALLGYYLDRLTEKTAVFRYVKQKKHGFEHLRHLLVERENR